MASSDARAVDRETAAAVEAIGSVVRLLCHLRMAVLALSAVTAFVAGQLTGGALLITALAVPFSYVPARTWDRRGEHLSRSGILLAADLVITAIVIAVMPDFQPVVVYAAATVALFGAAVGLSLALVMAAPIALLVLVSVNADPQRPHWAVGLAAALAVGVLAWAGSRIGDGLRAQARTARSLRLLQAGQAATLERVRIARDLHDTVAGDLAGIVLLTKALNRRLAHADVPAETLLLAQRLGEACEEAHQGTRVVLGELRRASDAPNLMLETTCRQWAERAGVAIDVDVDDHVADLSAALADDLRSILVEALENVRKHAGATRVGVRVALEEDCVRLVVTDDGRGIGADEAAATARPDGAVDGHFGLLGMRERAALHGGELVVTGAPGAGTTVTVRFDHERAGAA